MTSSFSSLKNDSKEIDLISVCEAIRKNYGTVMVQGLIVSLSKPFKMISKVEFYCDNCERISENDFPYPVYDISNYEKRCKNCYRFTKNYLNYDYKNVLIVELQDIENFNAIERLPVFLFEENTQSINIGEIIIVRGEIYIQNCQKNQKKFSTIFADSIEYVNRKEVILSKLDGEAIKRFTNSNKNNIIEKLVNMFDSSIIGYDLVKKGLLFSAVNTTNDISKKQRIHLLLIGDPGNAKSMLLKSITNLVPNSRYESGQHSTGKSLTAIVEKEKENYMLKLGPASLAKGSICAINEIGKISSEEQAHLLDIMEEGVYTNNKHGINATIKAPTTIIASSNPINDSEWKNKEIIDITEFPLIKPLIDRFDLIYIFRTPIDENYNRELADKISKYISNQRNIDYSNYLRKHILYAKTLNPRLTEEARIILCEYFVKIRATGFGSPRVLITLKKLSEAVAKLKLKEWIDEEDAKEVIEHFNYILKNFHKNTKMLNNPIDETFNECIKILKENVIEITLEDLMKLAVERNTIVSNYLYFNNKSLLLRENKKVRNIYDRLVTHDNVKRIQNKPIVLQWLNPIKDMMDKHDDINGHMTNMPDVARVK